MPQDSKEYVGRSHLIGPAYVEYLFPDATSCEPLEWCGRFRFLFTALCVHRELRLVSEACLQICVFRSMFGFGPIRQLRWESARAKAWVNCAILTLRPCESKRKL